jgi:hypothetical protein
LRADRPGNNRLDTLKNLIDAALESSARKTLY